MCDELWHSSCVFTDASGRCLCLRATHERLCTMLHWELTQRRLSWWYSRCSRPMHDRTSLTRRRLVCTYSHVFIHTCEFILVRQSCIPCPHTVSYMLSICVRYIPIFAQNTLSLHCMCTHPVFSGIGWLHSP